MDLAVLPTLETMQHQGLAGWRETEGHGCWVLMPSTAQQVADCLHWAQMSNRKIAMNPQEAALLSEPLWLDLSRLTQIRKHAAADFIVQVETGISLGALGDALAPAQQAFPLAYPAEMLLIDVLGSDRPALETGLKGYPRDWVLKTEIATPDGLLTISGADVVKNATGYDLHKLYVGGRHAFGVITAVTLKLAARARRHEAWLFTLDTLAEAEALSMRLLAGHLPVTTCELMHEAHGWRVFVQLAGDAAQLQEAGAALNVLSNPAPRLLGEREVTHFLHRLRDWPEHPVVAEVALPHGQWPRFADALITQPALQELRVQVRPAAGLIYLAFEEGSLPEIRRANLRTLSALAAKHDGFLQIARMPATETAALAEFNLPADPVARRLLKSLKNGYDPKGTLFCPQLPL